MSARDALLNYSKKQIKTKRTKRNSSPEKEVEKEVMHWLRTHGFSCHVVESKAVYSPSAGGYKSGQTIPGFSDVVGCDPNGMAVFIELKAKGRNSTLKEHQYLFLKNKIEHGAFAVCVDSVMLLERVYQNWCLANDENKRPGLIRLLPYKFNKNLS